MTSPPFDSTDNCQRQAWHDITALGQHTRSDNVRRGMTSPPLYSTHGRTTSTWHSIIAFGQHTRSNYVGLGMQTSPLGSTHSQTTSGVACQHRLWTAKVERRRVWQDITFFGQCTRSNDVERDMPSPPLESTHGRTKSGVACHHHLWATHTVELRWACHAIIAFRQHRRSDDVGRGMPSPPLDSTDGQMTLGVACHNRPWTAHTVGLRRAWHDITAFGQHTQSNDVGHGMPSSPLGSTHGRTTSGVACHNLLKAAQTIERRRAWHDITAFVQRKRSNDIECGMISPPFDCTHGRMTSGVA